MTNDRKNKMAATIVILKKREAVHTSGKHGFVKTILRHR
jgi:hypothetical protein